MRDRPPSRFVGRRGWRLALLALLLQIASPLLALDAMAEHLARALICGRDGTAHQAVAGLCPACPFCAAVQPAVAPAPLAALLPHEFKPVRPGRLSDIAGRDASAISAKARSPPAGAVDAA